MVLYLCDPKQKYPIVFWYIRTWNLVQEFSFLWEHERNMLKDGTESANFWVLIKFLEISLSNECNL